MDAISIAFATVIPVNLLLFLHHMMYAYRHIANESEKIYYYLTAIIPLAPAVMYSFQLIAHLNGSDPLYHDLLDVFFKTWVVSNPLIAINFGKVVNVPLRTYFVLVGADLCLYIIGYLALRTSNPTVFLVSVVFACILFCILMGTIIYLYHVKKYPDGHSNMLPLYRSITKFIFLSWEAYPIAFLLFKRSTISVITCAFIFIGLDFLTKAVFSSIIIGYHRHLQRRTSLIQYATRSSVHVIPLEQILTESPPPPTSDE